MTRKKTLSEMRQRKKCNKFDDDRKVVEDGKQRVDRIENSNSMGILKKTKGLLVASLGLNGGQTSNKPLKNDVENERKMVNSALHPEVFQRLSFMFKDLRIDWLKQIFKKRDETLQKTMNLSRSTYFSKEMVLSFTLMLTLSMLSRLYKVDKPSHVW